MWLTLSLPMICDSSGDNKHGRLYGELPETYRTQIVNNVPDKKG